MPPRQPDAAPKFWQTVADLMEFRPDFVSVTYGAGGKDHSTSLDVMARLVREAPVQPIAHLTCVGEPIEKLTLAIERYLEAGVRTFLALRGDPPENDPYWSPGPGYLGSAVELIGLIRGIEKRIECENPAVRLLRAFKPLTIAVATFPTGNPGSATSREQEIENLLRKEEAGADFAITQLFWRAEDYLSFVADASERGVTIPIVPGIMPATDIGRVYRTQELLGVAAPAELVRLLEGASSPEHAYDLGIEFGANLVRDVLAGGAPSIHGYTYNKSGPILDVLAAAGVTSRFVVA